MGWRLRRTFIVRVVSIYLDLLQISTVSRNAGLASFMLTEHTPDITFTTIIGVPRRFMGPMIEVSFRSGAGGIMLTPVGAIFRAFAYLPNPATFSVNPLFDWLSVYPTIPTVI